MGGDRNLKRQGRERVIELAEGALGSLIAPGVGPLFRFSRKCLNARREQRVVDFLRGLLEGQTAFREDECKKILQEEPLASELVQKLLEDEEDEKGWAYALLFRAFADNVVMRGDRLRFLRAVRELTDADLRVFRGWTKYAGLPPRGPHVVVGVRFGTSKREWLLSPELTQEEHPHLTDVLCRWGFITRRHERTTPAPAAGIGAFRSEAQPVPDRVRLEVNASLGGFLFVLAPWVGEPRRPPHVLTEMFATEMGRGADESFRATSRMRLQPTATPDSSTRAATQSHPDDTAKTRR